MLLPLIVFFSLHWAHIAFLLVGALLSGGIGYVLFQRYKKNEEKRYLAFKARQLQENEAARARFFFNASYDLRTPLTLILGPTRKLRTLKDEKKKGELLNMIHRNANRLLRLINQMLLAAKQDNDLAQLRGKQQDVGLFLGQLTQGFLPIAQERQIQLTYSGPQSGLLYYFDAEKLEYIYFTLLSNALEVTQRSGEISILLEAQPEGIRMQVADSGNGIPSDLLPNLFERNFQAGASEDKSGLALGLPLVKEFVEMHEGTIEVQSEPNKGTKFSLYFPFENPISRAYHTATRLPSTFEDAPENAKEAKQLLVIEPNADLRSLMMAELGNTYHLEATDDGEAGLAKAQESVPDLILLNRTLPGRDGLEVLKSLKSAEATSHIPIILLTAQSDRSEVLSGLEIGADETLVHPFDPEALRLKIRNLTLLRDRWKKRYQSAPWIEIKAKAIQNREDIFVQKAVASILDRLDDSALSVEELARAVGVSGKQLQRKLKALTSKTPNQLIRSVRLDKARELMAQTDQTIAEVGYAVGFSSPSYFTRVFQEEFEVTPSEFRESIS